jgi:hypothetical protein
MQPLQLLLFVDVSCVTVVITTIWLGRPTYVVVLRVALFRALLACDVRMMCAYMFLSLFNSRQLYQVGRVLLLLLRCDAQHYLSFAFRFGSYCLVVLH